GGTADRNRSHWSTSKTPSYTKSVSWQHHQQKPALQALFYLPALISGIYITVTVALHKVSLTYRTCFQPATAFKQGRNVHHNLLRLI
ncbi:hypothetical protein NY759_04225, partial [Escherichia coli]|uniref:hypothetical protein n=2 Tax=Escherichia coli TaxID=562 RepID=UPI002480CECB